MTLRLLRRIQQPDIVAVASLVLVWLLFFWRLFTPIAGDQASIRRGDFSGQFVAFGAYQYDRFTQGEVPLWNPYNNGGLPFIGDTQAAVFYPPRLATIALAKLGGGWSYHALELEMTFHVLAYTLFMYAFVRRLTQGRDGSVIGAWAAAVIIGYGGFTAGYPPLQLALLEAAIWLPLAALGLVEATRHERPQWRWLLLTGWALGMSWMAGHPQTSWFITYTLVAYWGYLVYQHYRRWGVFLAGVALFGGLSFGVTAVQFIPGVEYLMRTARAGLEFEAKSGGFPLQDMAQLIWPSTVSYFSPLYVGLGGLAVALIALWRRQAQALFWGAVALIALGFSLGENGLLYHAFYNVLPGLRFFRGQERAAYLFASSIAILAGLGVTHLATWDILQDFKATRQIRKGLWGLTAITGAAAGGAFLLWLGDKAAYGDYLPTMIFSFIVAVGLALVLPHFLHAPQQRWRRVLFVGFIAFELLWFNIDNDNFEPIPPSEQLSLTPPPLVQAVLDDTEGAPFRVDGWRGLTDNYGSMYRVLDMRGISPLFLDGAHAIIYFNFVNNRPAWEVFAVRYVYSGQETLGVPTEVVMEGEDREGVVYLHKLLDPRPFAQLLYQAEVLSSSAFARELLLLEPRFNAREEVILTQAPKLALPESAPEGGEATVTSFAPEAFTIEVSTPTNAILSVAHPYYPGWRATLDGEPTEILEAYGALAAVEVPSGEHTITFIYDPLSYKLGAILSLITWGALWALALFWISRKVISHAIK